MTQDRDIKYVNKTFTDFRAQLIEYAQNYFPDTYNDFSPAAPGTMFIEMAAYVGDVLSFYQDTQLQETYLQYAKNPANLYTLAYQMGYRPKISTVSQVTLEVSQTVGVVTGGEPDWSQTLVIPANTVVKSTSNGQTNFITDTPVDFSFSSSYDPTTVRVASLDTNGQPDSFNLVKQVDAYSGQISRHTETITSVEKFKTITISDTNILGVLSITDSSNNTWYEVPFLGQDTIFLDNANSGNDSSSVPYTLSLQKVPRRFVTRFTSTGDLTVQFGAGIIGTSVTDEQITPDPTNVGLGSSSQGISRLDYAYDPSNFIYTQTYGLAPSSGLTLTIKYLTGGGVSANVPANTITTLVSYGGAVSGDTSSVTFNNPLPAVGGKDGDSVEELRQNSIRAFSEQGRAVTLSDYLVRALSLPSKYGSIAKVHVVQDQLTNPNLRTDLLIDSNPLSLSLYTLAYDINKNLIQASPTLKNNLKTYLSQYMMVTDALNIRDAFVVNIGISYDIVLKPHYMGRDVLLTCTAAVQDYFNISNWSINQPINISDIFTLLDNQKGVQTVQKIEIVNLAGGVYSQYAYDIKGATRNNIIYPSYDPMIFELKFPDIDIKGRITTL